MRRLHRFEGMIDFEGDELGVKAIIMPTVHAPHVGADSPRHMQPGRRAEVLYYELFNDEGEDVTVDYFMASEQAAVKRLILEEWAIDQAADTIIEDVFSPTLAEVNARRGY